MMSFLLLALGIALLAVGGDALVRGSLAAAKRLGVSPLLSGLLIVGFGTSVPELVVSVDAALNHRPDIAVGNVVGSNIANTLLILGLCALVTPLAVKPSALRRDAVTVVGASLFFLVLVGSGGLGRMDAAIFLAALVGYLIWTYRGERLHTSPSAELHEAEAEVVAPLPQSVFWTVATVILGLLLLIAGSQVLIKGAVGIAQRLGVPEAVIGLTMVAVGTSLPELTISVVAALRRNADVAVGNVLGSNIFNLLGILGVSALLQPLPVNPRILVFDQWVMLGTALLMLFFLFTGRRLSRWEGGVLLACYGGYIALSYSAFIG